MIERIGVEDDKPSEACGVFGIYGPGMPVASLTYQGLQNLQHRGQEGAGIGASDGENILIYSNLGLVRDVFDRGRTLASLDDSFIATGHTRYGTTDTKSEQRHAALQPMYHGPKETHTFSIAHNGHVDDLAEVAEEYGVEVNRTASDTEIMKEVIGAAYLELDNLQEALSQSLPKFLGAYSLVLATKDKLYAARDPHGIRPLHLGRFEENEGWVIASEIAAIDIVGATPMREIAPGELIVIDGKRGGFMESVQFSEPEPATCSFEFVYFSRPDNEIFGESVNSVRRRMGELLAEYDDVKADMVIGVPDSGIIAADGYSRVSGIPHERNLVRNNYVDRSFIAPSQNERVQAVHNKLNPIKGEIKGKRVVIVDDSIVRGTTTTVLVEMLREAGAEEVHLRVSSPPYTHPCYAGMDTGRKSELIAATKTVEEIRQHIGADSLRFLTNEQMQKAVGAAAGKICVACTTGIYPSKVSIRSRDETII